MLSVEFEPTIAETYALDCIETGIGRYVFI
jgi:hypothetical protein